MPKCQNFAKSGHTVHIKNNSLSLCFFPSVYLILTHPETRHQSHVEALQHGLSELPQMIVLSTSLSFLVQIR